MEQRMRKEQMMIENNKMLELKESLEQEVLENKAKLNKPQIINH